MNIQELEDEHYSLENLSRSSNIWKYAEHTKLSIQFAIEILENLHKTNCNGVGVIMYFEINDKIEELKKYL